MKIIGITGSPGSGKSTVAEVFKRLGASRIDSDIVVHDLLSHSKPVRREIVNRFGDDVIAGNGQIDRVWLGNLVFSNPLKLKALEKILHPRVCNVLKSKIAEHRRKKNCQLLVLEVPLLFETGMDRLVGSVVVVRASRRQCLKRTAKRLRISLRAAARRMQRHWPIYKKLKKADHVIDNRGHKSAVLKQVRRIWKDVVTNE